MLNVDTATQLRLAPHQKSAPPHLNSTVMRTATTGLILVATLLVGGCANKKADSTATAAAEVEAEPQIAIPVNVPAVLARKVVMFMTGSKQVVEAKDWADLKRE
jgi:uncharacterized lipoprotein YmbA